MVGRLRVQVDVEWQGTRSSQKNQLRPRTDPRCCPKGQVNILWSKLLKPQVILQPRVRHWLIHHIPACDGRIPTHHPSDIKLQELPSLSWRKRCHPRGNLLVPHKRMPPYRYSMGLWVRHHPVAPPEIVDARINLHLRHF